MAPYCCLKTTARGNYQQGLPPTSCPALKSPRALEVTQMGKKSCHHLIETPSSIAIIFTAIDFQDV